MLRIFLFIAIFLPCAIFAENVYDRFFPKQQKTIFHDTMLERVLWHKKVSFLVIESLEKGFHVTLLVIPESPWNFKGTTYPLHYYFSSYQPAFDKFMWLDGFLKRKGVLKVKISGSLIQEETIMIPAENLD